MLDDRDSTTRNLFINRNGASNIVKNPEPALTVIFFVPTVTVPDWEWCHGIQKINNQLRRLTR